MPTDVAIDYTVHYRKLHQFSDEYYGAMSRWYRKAYRSFLPPDKQAQILDIGCGPGFLLNALRDMGYKNLQGIDADPGQVDLARARGLAVECVPAAETSEFVASTPSYDLICLVDVLEHVPREAQIG